MPLTKPDPATSQGSVKLEPPGPSGVFDGEPTTSDENLTPLGPSGEPDLQNAAVLEPVTVSAAFPLGSISSNDPERSDVIVLSSDHVFFGVHSHRLLSASKNSFCHRLPETVDARRAISGQHAPYILTLPEDSLVLNVVFHTIYGLSCAHYSPSLCVLTAAIAALKTYAIPLDSHLARDSPLYALILLQAPLPGRALESFALAAENELEDLAVAISPYVLPLEPDDIPDPLARRIGGVYMKRLSALRQRRHDAIRALVVAPPFPHAPDRRCTPADRQGIARAWLLAAAQLVLDFKPDMSPHFVRAILGSLSVQATCPACREALVKRTNEVVVQWSLLDRTI